MTIIACNPDDNEDEGGGNGNENKAGSLTITVKRKVKEKLQDNYGCLAVIGPNADSMNFFQYETGEVKGSEKPKVFLKNFSELKSQGKVIDTMYMQKGTGLDPLTNEKVGAIIWDSLPIGTYYLHVLDGNRHKYVTQFTVAEDANTEVLAETQKLGNLKVITSQSSISGNFLDGCDVRLYGRTSDTVTAVLTGKDPSEIAVSPYYQGVSATQTNENDLQQPGTIYFFNIPARQYYVAAHSESFSSNNQEQATEYVNVVQNLLTITQVNFQ
jgi:hypothetical protein